MATTEHDVYSDNGSIEDAGPAGARPDIAARGRVDGHPADLVRTVVDDIQLLLHKHVELARQEIVEALDARVRAVASGAVAGVAALFALGFLAAAAAHGLDLVLPSWASRLVVAGGFLLVTAGGAAYAKQRMEEPPITPEATKETLKEDVAWARARMRR